jgi:hypothetical protein
MSDVTRRYFFRQLLGGSPARLVGKLVGETLEVVNDIRSVVSLTAEEAGLELSRDSSPNSILDAIRRMTASDSPKPNASEITPGSNAGNGDAVTDF